MPKHVLYTGKKRKKSKFNRLQIEVFFLSSICPTYISPPLPPYLPEYRAIKFVLCPYIRPGSITDETSKTSILHETLHFSSILEGINSNEVKENVISSRVFSCICLPKLTCWTTYKKVLLGQILISYTS